MTAPASSLDEFLPRFHFSERHALPVAAPAARAWDALLAADLRDPAIVRVLLFLRGYGRRARRPESDVSLADRLAHVGFVKLGERAGRELVFGIVGRFWMPSGELRRVSAAEFQRFEQDGFAKAAWNFWIEPRGDSECLLTTETRILCIGEPARHRFRVYWFLIRPFSGWIRKAMLRSIGRRALARKGGT